jgi:hypothetical protein
MEFSRAVSIGWASLNPLANERYGLRASPGSLAAEIPLANEEAFHGARPMGPYSRPDRERKNKWDFQAVRGDGQDKFLRFADFNQASVPAGQVGRVQISSLEFHGTGKLGTAATGFSRIGSKDAIGFPAIF